MEDNYLHGIINVCYALDRVEFLHRVKGRYSRMILDEGDSIEVLIDGIYSTVSISEVLAEGENGQSVYDGEETRVVINPATTAQIEAELQSLYIKELFKMIDGGWITPESAMEMMDDYRNIYIYQKRVIKKSKRKFKVLPVDFY